MRPNNRQRILEAAVSLANDRGLAGVTLDSVSDAVGITKAGLLYHFAGKDALLLAIQEHLAAEWETELERTAGKAAPEATATERLIAYVRVCGRSATRAELTMQLEAASDDALNAPWSRVLERWRHVPSDPRDARSVILHSAALSAEGLWSAAALGIDSIPASMRARIVTHLVSVIESQNTPEGHE